MSGVKSIDSLQDAIKPKPAEGCVAEATPVPVFNCKQKLQLKIDVKRSQLTNISYVVTPRESWITVQQDMLLTLL